jgi:serine/threonine protein kinase
MAETGAEYARVTNKDVELSSTQLGSGGFAAVFKGSFRGKPVAMKISSEPSIAAEHLTAFQTELMVLSRCGGHPNVVRLLAADGSPPRPFLVMELCRESLFDALHGAGAAKFAKVPSRARALMGKDVAAAIEHLHSLKPASVVWRDCKSANILFSQRGPLVICDFGLVGCKTADSGTPAYLAPELWQGKPYGRAVDVFAFGVVLSELFTGRMPWAGYRPTDIREAVVKGERPPLEGAVVEGTPAGVLDLIAQCWAQDATLRPAMADVAARLQRLADECGGGAAGGSGAAATGGAGRGRTGAQSAAAGGAVDTLGAAMSLHVHGGGGRGAGVVSGVPAPR